MENRFQGLVLFLIGLSDLLVAHIINQAETADKIQISAPIGGLWVLGFILVLAGVIWAIIGEKVEVRVHWKR